MFWVLGCGLYHQRFDCYRGLVCCLEGLEEEGCCCLACPRISSLEIFGYIMIQIRLAYYAIYTWADVSVGSLAYDKAMHALHFVAKVSLLIDYIQIASNISRRRIKTHKHFIQPFTSSRTDPRIRQGTVFIRRFLQKH